MIGFYCFTSPAQPTPLTMRQKVAALSDQQRVDLLIAYKNAIPAEHLPAKLFIPVEVIQYVYDTISAMQERAKAALRGEIVITPAVLDAQGQVITPAVMNVSPTTGSALATNFIVPMFLDDFPGAFINDVLGAMFAWSKYDGSGSFAFYKSQIIL